MRVVKKGEALGTIDSIEAQRKADRGCYVCPSCGETRSADDYLYKEGVPDKGIFQTTTEKWEDNTEKVRRIRKDRFYCLACKAMWEGKPYIWEPRVLKNEDADE